MKKLILITTSLLIGVLALSCTKTSQQKESHVKTENSLEVID